MIRALGRPGRVPAAALLTALALLAAACSPKGSGTGPGGGGASPSPVASQALQNADEQFFGGHYAQAETAYRALAAAGDAHARAHLAVLLTYESHFQEAVQQAQQAVQQVQDSATLARLTRALDWSDFIPAAVNAGAEAVATAPVDPIAHDYYAEALSDAGRYTEAQRQLQLAQQQALTPYQQAEVAREWSNYYRDRGQPDDELNYVEIAQRAEPGFPERTLELAREYYGARPLRLADAQAQLRAAVAAHPDQPAVIDEAADSAFLGNDASTAETYYRRALAVQPGYPPAALGLAEVLEALKRDAHGAHDVLLDSLQRNPASADVYWYLDELDALVLKTDAKAELTKIDPQPPPGLDAERSSAYQAADGYRQSVSLPQLHPNAALEAAAEAHAYYYLFNFNQASVAGLGIHGEDTSLPGYTGANSAQRDGHFGYRGYQSSEVINHTFTAAAAVEVWADSVYHRYPLLQRESADAGYGSAQVGSLSVNVMDVGVGVPVSAAPLTYPASGQTGLPPTFTGNELPDPAPNATYPIGYPITVQAGEDDTLTLGSATLTGPDGKALDLYLLPPGTMDQGSNELSLIPKAPLAPATAYRVQVQGTLDGRAWSESWTFTTSP